MLAISLTIACSCYVYNGFILHAHPVRGESHNQRNATGEVATKDIWFSPTAQLRIAYTPWAHTYKPKAAKLILCCFRTSRNAAVLSDLSFMPLSNRRELHTFLFFHKKSSLTSPVLHSFLPLTAGEISAYSFRHAKNFQLPLCKRSLVHDSLFCKGTILWNSLPQYIELYSSFVA